MKASVLIATSLDGFSAREDGALDWLPQDGGEMAGTPSAVVARLAERGMKHLYIDGGVTMQRFLEAGLIQRVIITRVPVLLGSGIPLFGSLSREIRFEHVATRSYPSGLVQSEYVIAA